MGKWRDSGLGLVARVNTIMADVEPTWYCNVKVRADGWRVLSANEFLIKIHCDLRWLFAMSLE